MKCIAFESQNLDGTVLGVDDQVLADTGSAIECALGQQIVGTVGRTEDFDQEVGSAFNTPATPNGLGTRKEYHDIRIDRIGSLEIDIEWRWDNLSPSA
jgi:hypothetical protein